MYAGEYLTRGIGGGEVINLIHDDNGINYCFNNQHGIINPLFDDTVSAVIHTRFHQDGCFEVLGISIIEENGQLVYSKGYSLKEKGENGIKQLKEYVAKQQVNYGGVPYVKESDHWPSITFRYSKLLTPKQQVFIIDNNYKKEIGSHIVKCTLEAKRFAKTSLRMYVDNKTQLSAFASITDLINNEDLWEEKIIKINAKAYQHQNRFNLLTLIKKEDDELAFSKMFAYFLLNYDQFLTGFCKKVLDIDISDNYIIKREHKNIDIWIEDENNVVVIENKVKSGINGVSPRHDFSEDGKIQSQLLKYYKIGSDYAEQHGKEPHFFLYVPNYNKLDLKIYSGSRYYKVIRYKDIYNFLVTINIEDRYYQDFCNAIYKHTKDVPVDYSEIIVNYFIKQIRKQKNNM